MDISIILAQIFGVTFAVLGLSMMSNKKWTAVVIEEITKNQGVVWLAGLFTLVMGAVIVVLNNIWTSGLPLLITILGWATLIKGAFILLFPNSTKFYYEKMNKGNVFVWGGIIVLLLGLILLYS